MLNNEKKRILVLCVGNSCRSQIAEGFINARLSDKYEAFSAGNKPSVVNPKAIKVMAEAGIDISQNKSKHVDTFKGQEFDIVITVCDDKDGGSCPIFAGKAAQHLHWPFQDPAAAAGTEEEVMAVFRKVRDEIFTKFSKEL